MKMPVFHTKTIESILDPVAQQVSRLIIMHEETGDGSEMPDLERPVLAVSAAVANLVKVGKETILSSEDAILRQDMPVSLQRVGTASKYLEEASSMLKEDPFSQLARKKLIEGSRGILQGTSSLLLCLDESEVRKLVYECKRVLDYLAIAEVVDSMEDLVRFVQDISPCLSKVSRDVNRRQEELTHQVHREILVRCLDEIKTLTPILICSMKIYIQIYSEGGKEGLDAGINRDYLSQRMSCEISEIIRVLQLTTYDEEEWDADNLTGIKKALNIMQSKISTANDWLGDPTALRGGVGEKSLRSFLNEAKMVAQNCLLEDQELLFKHCNDISTMTDALCELRQNGKEDLTQNESLSRATQLKLNELNQEVIRAATDLEKSGVLQPAHTITGRLDQAKFWLSNPKLDDKGLGSHAILLVVEEARKVVDSLSGIHKNELIKLSDDVESLCLHLLQINKHGENSSAQSSTIANQLMCKLFQLKEKIQNAVVNRVMEDFLDTTTPLKRFAESVHSEYNRNGQNNFIEKANSLQDFSSCVCRTAKVVAAGGCSDNKKLVESILGVAAQVESLTPQLINAGKIRMAYCENQGVIEHFENLKRQYADAISKLCRQCDEAIDSSYFVELSEEAINKHRVLCEEGIASLNPGKIVDNTSAIARIGNRVLMVARQEADNSEDPKFIEKLHIAGDQLQKAVSPMIYAAKEVALHPENFNIASEWRKSNHELIDCVKNVRRAFGTNEQNTFSNPDFDSINFKDTLSITPPPRPPLPETDDEEEMFVHIPQPNQPIMMAAHGLHQEVRQWSSKGNDIVAAAKRMALLMARLSQLVRGEFGNKKDLISCSKEIAEASEVVTCLAKKLARDCTDKRIKTNLLQVCERIPTIGTQLKILSTVKATMLGAQDFIPKKIDAEILGGTEEDREATEMLVGNAQNLMQSVKETVRAAEAASIKMRTDAGIKMKWIRKEPWYHY